MTETYHELANTAEIKDESDLTIPRARALHDAIQIARDYSLVQIFRWPAKDSPALECFVVDVECDGVPSKNSKGILYRERLALCVPHDAKQLIKVLALRKDFPVFMHQFQVSPNEAASLCLYSESPSAVARTWTPQYFLRRIQWWLEKSSQGELHPSDQSVEPLFFTSNYELILPWNLDELRQQPGHRFVVIQGEERPDKSFTCFLIQTNPNCQIDRTVKHVDLVLPPIIHGLIERDPATLGQLSDMLKQRGITLIEHLRTALQYGIDTKGTVASASDIGTVILLHIPIMRKEGAKPEKIARRAFLVPVSSLELGVSCEALSLVDLARNSQPRYYKYESVSNTLPSSAWRDQHILPMEVLIQSDGTAARRQSGIVEAGPTGVLVGVGSLGSALLNLWGRGGWGRWSAIDNDHIKPHNLSRHTAYSQHIGQPKATVAAHLHEAAMQGATTINPIVADACNLEQEPVLQAIKDAVLVVDASTTLEYPRAASSLDTLPRHFSVFVTPDGNGAVLLAEDQKRSHRLRTLEAQYYRALIECDFGKTHLSGHASTFQSGASCRDISLMMPYSRILGHASTLAEQIQAAAAEDSALIRIWQRDPASGAVAVHDVPVMAEQCLEFGDLNLYIDEGVLQRLRKLRQEQLPAETGGVLLGYYDFNINAAVVVAGLTAPPDSKSSPEFFERGTDGLKEAVEKASQRTSSEVRYIGEWHSHPPGCSASPSRDDLEQLIYLSLGMADEGLPVVQIIIGEQDVQVLQGTA
jgi:hypothetical protein